MGRLNNWWCIYLTKLADMKHEVVMTEIKQQLAETTQGNNASFVAQ